MQKNKLILRLAAGLILMQSCLPLPPISTEDVVDDGLVTKKLDEHVMAYYTFDDGTAKSKAGLPYDGVLFGSPSLIQDTPSGKGQAVFLNGIKSQYINIPFNIRKRVIRTTIKSAKAVLSFGRRITFTGPMARSRTTLTHRAILLTAR